MLDVRLEEEVIEPKEAKQLTEYVRDNQDELAYKYDRNLILLHFYQLIRLAISKGNFNAVLEKEDLGRAISYKLKEKPFEEALDILKGQGYKIVETENQYNISWEN